jgi:hypothetical protein
MAKWQAGIMREGAWTSYQPGDEQACLRCDERARGTGYVWKDKNRRRGRDLRGMAEDPRAHRGTQAV